MCPRILTSSLLLVTLAVPVLATDSSKKVKLKGHLVDVQCALEQKDDPNYIRTSHSKSCFQMPACVKSGYAILTPEDQVIRFDAAGNELAKKLIAANVKDKDWRIKVRGKQTGDQIEVNKLELEK